MLIAAERLLIRIRHPASRADELNALRARLRAEHTEIAGDDERALAQRIVERKRAISERLGAVTSCRSCETQRPPEHDGYTGGACCGGVTAELFDDHELAALAQGGTRPADLTPPAGGALHIGCVFRGPRGCTLDVADRPGRCVLYLCVTLRRELHRDGQLDELEHLLAELQRDMTEFIARHGARVDRDVLAPLVAALEDYARR